jgi:putative oxidoreductase
MRALLSTKTNEHAVHFSLLLLRILIAVVMGFYGFEKLKTFQEMANSDFWNKDINFLGLGGKVSLALTIFAELFCSIFLLLGLFTRYSLVPLLICMGYIVVVLDKYKIVTSGEHGFELNHAFTYFVIYLCLFLTGPGKWSMDKLLFKK